MTQFDLNSINLEDQSVVEANGGGHESLINTPEAVGPALLRLTGYIETGLEKKQQGEGTDDKVQLIFDVVSPRHVKEGTKEDGTPYRIVDRLSIYLKKGSNAKSGFMNFFTAMNYNNDKKHFAEMLGQAFLADLFPKTDTNGVVDPKGRNVIHDGWNGKYTIRAPKMQDPITGAITEIAVPEAKSDLRLFLWDHPTQEMWDSINIGDKAEDDEKNFLKAQIKKAVNFEGSPVQAFLNGGKVTPIAKQAPAAEVPAQGNDPLAALGM